MCRSCVGSIDSLCRDDTDTPIGLNNSSVEGSKDGCAKNHENKTIYIYLYDNMHTSCTIYVVRLGLLPYMHTKLYCFMILALPPLGPSTFVFTGVGMRVNANSPTAIKMTSPVIPYVTATTKMPTYRNDIPVSSPSVSLSKMHSTDEAITSGESLVLKHVFLTEDYLGIVGGLPTPYALRLCHCCCL